MYPAYRSFVNVPELLGFLYSIKVWGEGGEHLQQSNPLEGACARCSVRYWTNE